MYAPAPGVGGIWITFCQRITGNMQGILCLLECDSPDNGLFITTPVFQITSSMTTNLSFQATWIQGLVI